MGLLRGIEGGTRRQGLDRQCPPGKAVAARAPGRCQKSPVPGRRRQSADAFCAWNRTPCVTLFTCTSPWEIYDYGVQEKIVSPLLEEFFYKRGYDERAVTAIGVEEVFDAVMEQLESPAPPAARQKVTI